MRHDKHEDNFDNFPSIGGLMVSKMVADENIKPRFMYREKRTLPNDSGWRIFTGLESQEYTDNEDNIGIYNPTTILKIDPSIKDILLKGIGSVYEKLDDNSEWLKVRDFEMDDDFMTTHKLTDDWTIEINNLFERTIEKDGGLLYTTGDKSVRLIIWNEEHKSKEVIYAEYEKIIDNRDQSVAKTLRKLDFSDISIARVGYLIKEVDGEKSYNVMYGFSIVDNQIIQVAFYFDDDEEISWAIETWKEIKIKK